MSLVKSRFYQSYAAGNNSVGVAVGAQAGTLVTAGGSAHTYGSWTQIHAGLTYTCPIIIVRINAVETSADVIAATTLNVYIDIGIGPDSSNVTVVLDKLGGSQSQGLGTFYYIPVTFPKNTPIWARHQNTAASAKAGVEITFCGGGNMGSLFPSFSKLVAIGDTSASTVGTTMSSVGNSGAEGSWNQIVASSANAYKGVMVSPMFNVDLSLTNGLHQTFDIAIGGSGSEIVIAEAITQSYIWSNSEQRDAVCFPAYYNIPVGTRIAVRASGSTTNDGTNSVILYGLL